MILHNTSKKTFQLIGWMAIITTIIIEANNNNNNKSISSNFDFDSMTPISIGEICSIRELQPKTVSAINRASTESCKMEIERVACAIERRGYYPDYILNTCPMGKYPGKEYEHIDWDESMRPARIFYLLQLHGRAVQQILRLFRAIYNPSHFYYLHVDAYSDYLHHSLLPLEAKYKNVVLARDRYRTMWGGISLLEMVLSAMREALWGVDWEWDYFINLSGADFPLRTNEQLTQLLAAQIGENFLKSNKGKLDEFIRKQGIDQSFIQCDDHMWNIGHRKLPEGIVMDGGSDWVILHRDFIRYVLTTDNVIVTGLETIYKHTLLPVESYFHTIIRNSIYCHMHVKDSLRLVNWNHKLGCKCQYKHIVDWCSCSPNNIRIGQLRKLIDQPNYLVFARKFESIVDNAILNTLESYITSQPPQLTNLYTESVYDREFSHQFSPEVLFVLNMLLEIYRESNQCDNTHDLITEVFTVRNEKRFGLIIETTQIQIYYTYKYYVVYLDHDNKHERFIEAVVGTGLDTKERIFRNYLDILTVHDSPQLFIRWKQGTDLNISIDWYSPCGVLMNHYVIVLEGGWTFSYQTPTWVKPLETGVWMVEVSWNGQHFISLQFMIFSSEIGREEVKTLADRKFEVKDACRIRSKTINSCNVTNKCKKTVWSNMANDILREL